VLPNPGACNGTRDARAGRRSLCQSSSICVQVAESSSKSSYAARRSRIVPSATAHGWSSSYRPSPSQPATPAVMPVSLLPDPPPVAGNAEWAAAPAASTTTRLSRFAGVSEAGARRRNPERSEGSGALAGRPARSRVVSIRWQPALRPEQESAGSRKGYFEQLRSLGGGNCGRFKPQCQRFLFRIAGRSAARQFGKHRRPPLALWIEFD